MSAMLPHHGRALAAAAATACSLALWGTYLVLSRRLTPAQVEERRRTELAARGRIIDGMLTGAHPSDVEPRLLFYTYRVAGVTYECSQQIPVRPAHPLRLDHPIQVRYSPQNPANSIVLAESWNGLWDPGYAESMRTGTH